MREGVQSPSEGEATDSEQESKQEAGREHENAVQGDTKKKAGTSQHTRPPCCCMHTGQHVCIGVQRVSVECINVTTATRSLSQNPVREQCPLASHAPHTQSDSPLPSSSVAGARSTPQPCILSYTARHSSSVVVWPRGVWTVHARAKERRSRHSCRPSIPGSMALTAHHHATGWYTIDRRSAKRRRWRRGVVLKA